MDIANRLPVQCNLILQMRKMIPHKIKYKYQNGETKSRIVDSLGPGCSVLQCCLSTPWF